jgi:hypothetical protein
VAPRRSIIQADDEHHRDRDVCSDTVGGSPRGNSVRFLLDELLDGWRGARLRAGAGNSATGHVAPGVFCGSRGLQFLRSVLKAPVSGVLVLVAS